MTEKKKRILTYIAAALIVTIPFACNLALKKVHYSVKSDKLMGNVKIAFISDLHNSRYGENMREIVDSVREYNPDVVVFGGDLYDEYWGENNADLLVDRLVSDYRCFYTVGNHEKHTDDAALKRKMTEKGVIVLENTCYDLEIRGNKLRFTGLESLLDDEICEKAFSCVSSEAYNILIDHYPEHFPKLSDKGFDLVLSGHAHGGQVIIPFVLNGVYAPNQGLFPKYAGGYYSENGTEMIVSRGLHRNVSNIAIPRVFNRPELVFVTLEENRQE